MTMDEIEVVNVDSVTRSAIENGLPVHALKCFDASGFTSFIGWRTKAQD